MKLLAFETATEACSVALAIDGEIVERYEIAPRRHAELALPWADALLAEAGIARAQLDAIAVGRGPGAFTGVRLAIAIAQGVALGLDRPLVPVSTLAALALPAVRANPSACVLAAIDARMNELYVARYRALDGDLELLGEEQLLTAADVVIDGADWRGVGTGFAAQERALATRFASQLVAVDAAALPHAADIARLALRSFERGGAIAPERVEPAYLRNNVALTLLEQQALRDSRK
ncbi:tRNA (adenosine(37)-N6)-threonylcarbamoyltransferase complex dimerization subunit type 1 TsaB [Lysobacter sp. TY2-98]|uniref:tRNA (adenosine(37)-N6)-threonylcarbamoyltransferase complex dimerization subunit type 1 TsaB n=1 Tax=Lysobacter sp. TY2-98 TaxID=2290922 RepID=UPI000E208C7A|nr:tRNA (adenosine(37)-N6)-threonylcarbamoyltransferase complex dimerization subunit type 1 TsaB [Lysobacter sp. TY2-98]AXK71080.1 tRNA (adenosine(37)-N6)-threonylcarbamoyltransferase complex dimerization subunit type 1 TsaB [Lysobacter sp. TY2-98]